MSSKSPLDFDDRQDGPAHTPLHRSVEWYRGLHRFILSVPSLRTFSDIFGGEAVLSLPPSELIRLHTKAAGFFHRSRDDGLADAFSRIVSAYAQVPDGAHTAATSDPAGPLLKDRGYAALPSVADALTRGLRDYFMASPLVPSDALRRPEFETVGADAQALRRDHNLAYVPRSRMLRAPGLLPLAVDPTLLALLHDYLGAPPILTDIAVWQSFAGDSGPKEARDAQLFHFDLDNYRFCKVFVYLTDVDETGGPHIFVPTTHRLDVIRERRPGDGDPQQAEFDNWYYQTVRKSESELRKWIGAEPTAITGAAGTRFIADTKGLHRGCPPARHDRWLLQFVYGTTPATVWFENHRPRSFLNEDGGIFKTSDDLARYCLSILFPGL